MEAFSFRRFGYAVAAMVVVLLAGTIAFRWALGEHWLQAFYRSVVSSSLTGLDTTPKNDSARVITILIVLSGFGRVGRRVAEEFREADAPFVVLDFSEAAKEAATEENVLFIEGDGTNDDDLREAGIGRARGLVAASDDDADNLYITLSARAAKPDLLIVARASNEDPGKK